MTPRVLDLFAGAGGFSLGFQMAGFEVVGAVERDKWAAETFQFNHPSARTVVADLELLSDARILDLFGPLAPQVLIGGPPCQGFSICRANAGDPKDPRNSLFTEFIRVARLLEPEVVLMENVPNLTKARTHSNELVIQIIEQQLRDLGYSVHAAILHATDFGVPQIRRRLFVLASKRKLNTAFPLPTYAPTSAVKSDLFSEAKPQCPSLWDAISDLPQLESGEGSEEAEYVAPPLNQYQELLRAGSKVLHNHKAMRHTPRMVSRFASMSWGHSAADVADHLKPFKRNSGGVVSDRIYDQNNRRMHPYQACHTIPASFYANFVHPFQNRNFTAREGARIQSFPDWYVFKGKPTVVSNKLLGREGRDEENYLCQYAQIGNAVPPLLARALAETVRDELYLGEVECTVMATT